MPGEHPDVPTPWVERVTALLGRSTGRTLLGLAGPPGAGKSTLALALQRAFAPVARVVPMDGYHLAQRELERLGRAQRKGAPDTFDAAGYAALLRRLRAAGREETVYAPEFRREIEEPIAGAIAVTPDTRLVIAEGNYLLLPEPEWAAVRACLDEVWYVEVPDALRVERLTERHRRHGRSAQQAIDWVRDTDEPNARRIAASRGAADAVFRWE